MRKMMMIAAVAGLFMASCKKDYTCACTVTSTWPGYPNTTSSGSTGKMKKKDAEAKCNEGDQTTTSTYMDPTTGQMESYKITSACDLKE
jgi:hypothetical protein